MDMSNSRTSKRTDQPKDQPLVALMSGKAGKDEVARVKEEEAERREREREREARQRPVPVPSAHGHGHAPGGRGRRLGVFLSG